MRAPSYVNHVVFSVASGAFSVSCSNLFLVMNDWLIVPVWPYAYGHVVAVRDWAWSCVYWRLVIITVSSELPTKRPRNSWCNLLAYVEWKMLYKCYLNCYVVWRELWPASCSKRSAPAVDMSSFWNKSISCAYHFSIILCVSSTNHGGTVRAAIWSAISVRTPCQCISTSRNRGVARRSYFQDQSSEVNSAYSSAMWLV